MPEPIVTLDEESLRSDPRELVRRTESAPDPLTHGLPFRHDFLLRGHRGLLSADKDALAASSLLKGYSIAGPVSFL